MKKHLQIWNLINRALTNNVPVILLYVLESKGSSPGRQGFFMAVANDSESGLQMEGSIGGGIMEHKFVELAKEMLIKKEDDAIVKQQVHDKSAAANQSGMICSGEQTIFLYPLKLTDASTIKNIIQSLEENKNGTLTLTPDGISFTHSSSSFDYEYIFNREDDWIYKEKTGYKNKLFIVGGGHCSLALSALVRTMDFYVTVLDDREDLKTMVANDAAHEKHVLQDYTDLGKLINNGENHYVVIMTFGYRTDDIALRAVLKKQLKYLGVLGSQKKMEKLFSDYRSEGIPAEQLKKIYTPIGIDIHSQTPEEIAISIAAQLITVKNEYRPAD